MPYTGTTPSYQQFPVDTFSGNGSQVTFTLSFNVTGESSILVWVNGLKKFTYEYQVNGTQLTIFTPPSAGNGNIEVFYLNVPETAYAIAQGVTSVGLVTSLSGIVVTGSPITSTGTFAISGTLNVSSGGTGAIAFPTNQILLGNGTSAIASVTSLGANGQVLTSQSTNAPIWTDVVNSINFGSTGLTGSSSAGNITVNGTVKVSSGGTGDTTFNQYDVLLGNNTDPLTSVGSLGTVNFVLTSNGAGQKPSWQAKPTADSNWGVGALILCQLDTSASYDPGQSYTGDIIIYGIGSSANSVRVTGTFLILGAVSANNEECFVFRTA